jgi:hypothetical protein
MFDEVYSLAPNVRYDMLDAVEAADRIANGSRLDPEQVAACVARCLPFPRQKPIFLSRPSTLLGRGGPGIGPSIAGAVPTFESR